MFYEFARHGTTETTSPHTRYRAPESTMDGNEVTVKGTVISLHIETVTEILIVGQTQDLLTADTKRQEPVGLAVSRATYRDFVIDVSPTITDPRI